MKRIIAFTLACLLASPVWAGDFPTPGSASHRARDDGWIDVDNLPFLCDDAHGRGAYNICKENGNGSGLILHETESTGEGELLTFLNDTANQAVGMALGGGGEFFIQHFANLHFYENGGEDIVFNEGWIIPPFERGLDWPGENIRIRSIDDGNLQITVDGGDHGILELYDDNAASINDDEPYNINVYSSNDDDEDINVGGITWIWDDVTLDSEDTRIIFFTTVGGVEEVDQLQISNGVSIGPLDTDPGIGNLFVGGMPNPSALTLGRTDLGVGNDVGQIVIKDQELDIGYGAITVVAENITATQYEGKMILAVPTTENAGDFQDQMAISDGVTIGSADGDPGVGNLMLYDSDNNDVVMIKAGGDGGQWLQLNVNDNDVPLQIAFDSNSLLVYEEDTDNVQLEAIADGANADITLLPKGAGGIYAVQPSTAVNDDNLIKVTGWKMIPLMAGAGTVPSGGGIAGCTPVSAFDSGSNDVFLRQCSFSASTDNAIYFTIPFGSDWDHFAVEPEVNIRWTSATTTDSTDDVIWNASIVCFSNDDAINGNAFPADDAVTDTQTAAGDILRTGAITGITAAGSPADEDTCVLRVRRDADNGSDNFNGTAELISVELWTKDDQASEF